MAPFSHRADAYGRERTGHWAPRTLDVDLIMVGTTEVADEDLRLPHANSISEPDLKSFLQVRPAAGAAVTRGSSVSNGSPTGMCGRRC